MSVGVEGSFNRQISSEHGGLSVFSLLQFILGFLAFVSIEVASQHETRKGFTVQNLNHRLIGLLPDLSRCGKSLNKVVRHSDVLAALTGIHVGDFGFCRHG